MSGIVLTGSTGQVGRAVQDHAALLGLEVHGLARGEADPVDLLDRDAVAAFVRARRPDAIVHAAALTDVDRCQLEPDLAQALNVDATALVAELAAEVGAHLVVVSTNYVFDGTQPEPYATDAPAHPISTYGRTKLAGEHAAGPDATVVRTAWVAGSHKPNLVRTVIGRADAGGELWFVDDQVSQATIAHELAPALLHLAAERAPGTWHVANPGIMSPYAWARTILEVSGRDPDVVQLAGPDHPERSRPAPRPRNGAFDLSRWQGGDGPALAPYPVALRQLLEDLGLLV